MARSLVRRAGFSRIDIGLYLSDLLRQLRSLVARTLPAHCRLLAMTRVMAALCSNSVVICNNS
ncbi:hypothetical protein HOE425_330651 [Hoeflea sp. EC-HK425]|nr:hypothetical protein HOE425_330651 [Hoeflea sp. EC-HK425]